MNKNNKIGLGFLLFCSLQGQTNSGTSVDSLITELENLNPDQLSLDKLSQVKDLNVRLEEMLNVEQKYMALQKLRRERHVSTATIGSLQAALETTLEVQPKLSSMVPTIPLQGYAVQRLFRRGGVNHALVMNAQGQVVDVTAGSRLSREIQVTRLTAHQVIVRTPQGDHPLPFSQGQPSSSAKLKSLSQESARESVGTQP